MKKFSLIVGLCALLALSTTAFAGSCTTVACVAPTDSINWGNQGYGPSGFTPIPSPQPWSSLTNSGTLSVANSPFYLLQQGNQWGGNFFPNDYLIYNGAELNGNTGPISVTFSSPVFAAGAQIQAAFFGSFTATINAYNSKGTLLDSFSEIGNSNGNGDGSAIFIGLKEGSADISSITFSLVDINGNNDEAIDTVYFNGASPIPEPSSLTLLLFPGLLGALNYGRRRLRL